MRKVLGFVFALALGALLFWSVGQNVGWQEILRVLSQFSGGKGIILIFLTLLVLLAGTFRWKEILRSQGYRFSFLFLLRSYLGGFTLSFFAPMMLFGNEAFRAYSLEASSGIPFQKALPSTVIERLLESTVYLVIIIAGFAFLLATQAFGIPAFLWWVLIGIVGLVALLGFFYFKSFKKESVVRMFFPRLKGTNGVLEIEQEVLSFFHLNNQALWEGLALSFVKGAATLIRTMILAMFLGTYLGAFSGVAVTTFYLLSLLLPIPGQLGSHEALQALGFEILGLGAGTGVAFALLVRAAELMVALVGLVFLARFGLLILKTLVFQKAEKLAAQPS